MLKLSAEDRWLWIALGCALAMALMYFGMVCTRPLLDEYSLRDPSLSVTAYLRQTQTAFNSYWMIQDGYSLAYQLPVLGYPWTVPFEFPTYQATVVTVVRLLGTDLGETGRAVSFLLSLLALVPATALLRLLQMDRRAILVFAALYLSTPLYLFWSACFLIESCALLLTLSSLYWALRYAAYAGGWRCLLLFGIFGAFAGLTKLTVYGPALLVTGLWALAAGLLRRGIPQGGVAPSYLRLARLAVVALITVALTKAWVDYSDQLKLGNLLSAPLASGEIALWNFGSLEQRYSSAMADIARRLFSQNPGLLAGLVLAALLASRAARSERGLAAVLLLLFLAPILIFTNLHFIHVYYQTECLVFLIAAIAVVLCAALQSRPQWLAAATMGMVLINLYAGFHAGGYLARGLAPLSPQALRTLHVAEFVRGHTQPADAFMLYGYDWSSEVHYYAQRRGVAVPDWVIEHKAYKEATIPVSELLGGLRLGAVVICPSLRVPDVPALAQSLGLPESFTMQPVDDCRVYLAPGA